MTVSPRRHRPRSSQRKDWQTHELGSSSAAKTPGELGTLVSHFGVAVDVRLDSGPLRSVKVKRRSGHVVGDRVEVVGERLHRLERRTALKRRDMMGHVHTVAANLDTLGIVVAAIPPTPDGFVDRALVAAGAAGLSAILVVNKADLPEAPALLDALRETWLVGAGAIEIPLFLTSATAEAAGAGEVKRRSGCSSSGIDALLDYFEAGHRGVFVGTSGVGKSSLVNALLPALTLPVGEINQFSGLGRHTTTTATLHALPRGGELVDTPGFRDFGLVDIDVVALSRHFPGFAPLLASGGCRFNDCKHRAEPDCAIKAAVADGRLARPRWDRYLELLAELEG